MITGIKHIIYLRFGNCAVEGKVTVVGVAVVVVRSVVGSVVLVVFVVGRTCSLPCTCCVFSRPGTCRGTGAPCGGALRAWDTPTGLTRARRRSCGDRRTRQALTLEPGARLAQHCETARPASPRRRAALARVRGSVGTGGTHRCRLCVGVFALGRRTR